MADYINSPAEGERSMLENRGNNLSGWSKVFLVVGVSFGLLCIVQSALNVSLRLWGIEFCNKSELIRSSNVTLLSAADVSALLLEKDQLAKENRELLALNSSLSRDNEMLNDRLTQQQDTIIQLQAENTGLRTRLYEKEQTLQSCSQGWRPIGTSCYQISTETQSWLYARDDCKAKGARLVVINDVTEEDVFQTLGVSDVWIGLRATQVRSVKVWTWLDGRQLTDVFRIQPQPDDNRFLCAFATKSSSGFATWVRTSCLAQLHWLCEKKMK